VEAKKNSREKEIRPEDKGIRKIGKKNVCKKMENYGGERWRG
jgi:hypothetical protein